MTTVRVIPVRFTRTSVVLELVQVPRRGENELEPRPQNEILVFL